jgi:hypothetical protein
MKHSPELRTEKLSSFRGNEVSGEDTRRWSMYYRVAFYQSANQAHPSPAWQWQSTALSSLNSLLQWLQVYRVFPPERLRIFSSSSREALNEQLVRENQGLTSTSVPAPQFLQARGITPRGAAREAGAGGAPAHKHTAFIPAKPSPSPDESGMSPLDKRREELEHGAGGDHDLPYRFTLSPSLPQVLAWVKLLARVQQGDFQPEVGAFDERQPQHPGGFCIPTYAPYGKKLARCVFTATTGLTTSG